MADNSAQFELNTGMDYFQKGDFEKAVSHFKKYNDIGKPRRDVWKNLGIAQGKLYKYLDAYSSFQRAMELLENPDKDTLPRTSAEEVKKEKAEVLGHRGYTLIHLEDYEDALTCYKRALNINRENAKAWFYKGYAYLQLENPKEALKCYNCVVELKESVEDKYLVEEALVYRGFIQAGQNEMENAAKSFETAKTINKFSTGVWRGQEYLKDKSKYLVQQEELLITAKKCLNKLFDEFKTGLKNVAYMFTALFGIGIGILILALALLVTGGDSVLWDALLAGGIGTALIVAFVWRSPMIVQNNRVDLSQWMITYSNWINTLLAVNGMIADRNRKAETLTWDEMKPIYEYLWGITEKTVDKIEQCCEFGMDSQKLDLSGAQIPQASSTPATGGEAGKQKPTDTPVKTS